MKIVFLSNYFNHHQKPFSDALYAKIGDGYTFVETKQMSQERKNMGWGMESYPPYVVSAEKLISNLRYYIDLINNADAVIIGSASEELIKERKNLQKLIFRYSERPLKKGIEPLKYIPRFIKWRKKNPRNIPIYMLCASAYTAKDYAKFGLFKNKCFKWAYFTECKKYDDVESLIETKKRYSLLWVARFLKLKHPEAAVEVTRRLREDGYDVTLDMIGTGPIENEIRELIKKENLAERIHIFGSMKPEQVREHMEKSEIFMFTSDRNEGWGAVVNEAMNSGCAVVGSDATGVVPFLIKDGENGLIYKSGNVDELYKKVKWLIDNDNKRKQMSKEAYKTIEQQWNAENASTRLLVLVEKISAGEDVKNLFTDGVCSLSK